MWMWRWLFSAPSVVPKPDERDYLKEAFEYALGERRTLPSIEHIEALYAAFHLERKLRCEALEIAVSLKQAIDVRDELIRELVIPPLDVIALRDGEIRH